MEINKRQLKRLTAFGGYGNPSSKLWFIGIEEKLPTPETWKSENRARERFRRVMDLHDSQEKLGHCDVKDAKTQTWTWMAKFARAILDGAKDWENLRKAKCYRNCLLGRSRRHMGETFLTELFPVPLRNCSQYPESYDSRKAYEYDVWPRRRELLRKMINKHKPRWVLSYSEKKEYQQKFREVVSGNKESKLIRLPFFGNGKLSTRKARQVIAQLKMEAIKRNEL